MSTTAMWLLAASLLLSSSLQVCCTSALVYELALAGVMALSLVAYCSSVSVLPAALLHLSLTYRADRPAGRRVRRSGRCHRCSSWPTSWPVIGLCRHHLRAEVPHRHHLRRGGPQVFKLHDLDRHSSGYLVKVIVAASSGLLLNVFTAVLGYFRNVLHLRSEFATVAQADKIAGGVTFVNSAHRLRRPALRALRPALDRAVPLQGREEELSAPLPLHRSLHKSPPRCRTSAQHRGRII